MNPTRGTFHSLAIIAGLLLSTHIAHAGPYMFWVNNNYDRTNYSSDDGGIVQDDLNQIQILKLPASQQVPDCNYINASGQRAIPCTRDLEDFARLWVGGVTPSLIAALPAGSTLTLSWNGVTANPTIDLFAAADPGIGYQTNEIVATQQIDPVQCPYLGRISPTSSLTFTKSTWPTNQFIWCGVDYGYGALTLTIADGNSNVLAQTPVYIELVDIKQMYECWTVGDRPNFPPTNTPVLASDFIAPGAVPFQYTPPADANTSYILLVHGWNMTQWEKDRYAECAYKRLYWQGYQGRFGVFRWPTGNGISGIVKALTHARNYDNSENQAWQSSVGLTNLLTQLNAEYPGHVYLMAHSMGNVVAGEALRRASSQLVKTYIAMQGAVPAHCYDPSTPDKTTYSPPDDYANYWTSGAPSYFNASAGAGSYVNFYNTNDYALHLWLFNQSKKPDESILYYPDYYYSSSSGFYKILGPATNQTIYLNFPTNTYEIFAYGDPSWSYALGAQSDVDGAFAGLQIDLQSIWPVDPYNRHNYSTHFWHSAEFRGDYPMQVNFWKTAIGPDGFNLK